MKNLVDPLFIILSLLGVISLVRLLIMRRRKWKQLYTTKEKDTWVALFLMSMALAEGGLEAYKVDAPGGPRLILFLLTGIAIVRVTLREDDRRIVIRPRMIARDDEEDPEDRSGTAG